MHLLLVLALTELIVETSQKAMVFYIGTQKCALFETY